MIAGRARGWMLCVLLLSLAHVATAQLQAVSCAIGMTDCDGTGALTTCCACAAGKYKSVADQSQCIECVQELAQDTLTKNEERRLMLPK